MRNKQSILQKSIKLTVPSSISQLVRKALKSVKLFFMSYCFKPAHFMDPDDKNILIDLARSFLGIGDSKEALRCAESVLKKVSYLFQDQGIIDKDLTIFKNVFSQDPKNIQAIVIKAKGLYQMCRFEHAFALFSKVTELARRGLCNL